MKKMWRSGLIFTAANFLVGIGNFAFQTIIGNHITSVGQYGLVNSTLVFINLLGLPVAIATQAVTHYVARFNFTGDDRRLQGLLAGCHKFLLRLTILGSLLAVLLVKPLGDFFHFPTRLVVIALVCVLAGLWGGFATALCQGMAWFKRLALISILTVLLRLAWGGLVVWKFPTADWAVMATGVSTLSFAILLFWKKDLSWSSQGAVSPWDREFIRFFIVAAACTGGTICITQGDLLVANKYFLVKSDMDAYSAAGVLARALTMTVGPLLTILFTHRSSAHAHSKDDLAEQFKMLGLYSLGLAAGAIGLLLLRTYLLALLHKYSPEAAAMVGPLAWTMVFVGLMQALGMWALASRWLKVSLLYGGLGLAYWLTLLFFGTNPAAMLRIMPLAAGVAFAILFAGWLMAMRKGSHTPSSPAKA